MKKFIFRFIAGWTQFRWSQFCWQYPKHHRSQSNIRFLLPIRPDQGVDPGHINVLELLHSLFDLVLIGPDIHNEHKCVVFYFLHGWLSSQGELDDGIVIKLVSPGGALLRVFGLPSETQGLGSSECRWRADLLFFLWLCTPFSTAFLALASALGRAEASFFPLEPSSWKVESNF